MKTFSRLCFLFCLLFLISNHLHAQWAPCSVPCAPNVISFAMNGTSLFAGSVDGTIYRSTDFGVTWTLVFYGITDGRVMSLAGIGTTIIAGVNGGSGTYISTDNGTTWAYGNVGTTGTYVSMLVVNGSSVFAGTENGLLLSIDNGRTWTYAGLSMGPSAMAFMGTDMYAVAGAVYRSNDNGATWNSISSGIGSARCIVKDGINIYVGTDSGIWLTSDIGGHWTQIGLPNSYVTSIECINHEIYAGVSDVDYFTGSYGNGGVFRLMNNGTSWTTLNTGLMVGAVSTLTKYGSSLFVGTNIGIFYYLPPVTWSHLNNGFAAGVSALTFRGTSLFAGTCGGVYRSTDRGTVWTQTSLGYADVRAFANNTTTLFAGTKGTGVYASTNDGASWMAANIGLTNKFVNALAISGTNLFAATDGGIFRSANGGAGWIAVDSGLTNFTVRALAVSGPNLFAGTNVGVFVSLNDGANWTPINSGLTMVNIRAVAISGQNLFVGGVGGIYRSTNSGTDWNQAGLTSTAVGALSVYGLSLFAGTSVGVFLSNDMGASWIAVNSGLPTFYVGAFAVVGNDLFAGTNGNGVWYRPLSQMITGVETRTGLLPSEFMLAQNYPNPFNPATTISYALPSSVHVTLSVMDILGREVQTLVNEIQIAGNYRIQFGPATLPSGVYLYHITAGNFVQTKKLLLLK